MFITTVAFLIIRVVPREKMTRESVNFLKNSRKTTFAKNYID